MSTHEIIRSVGIDIGTTTTQVIFSRLELVNRAAVSQIPSYEFSKREIVYQSPVIFTPINFEGQIREDELLAFILQQYQAAGVTPTDINSGAIIITGETSKARNARPAILKLSETLGDFVVATAGPNLESIIAGHGSGAAELSRQQVSRVLNIDIGGGTANYALFEAGNVAGTACLNVGGRLLETDTKGTVLRVHSPAKRICHYLFGENVDLLSLSLFQLKEITACMADLLYQVIINQPSALATQLLMTKSLPYKGPLQALTISGGIGACLLNETEDNFKFNDIGNLLAGAIRNNKGFASLPLIPPKQTERATVIGAGAHTLSLSGSTIWLKNLTLPIRNIPVIHGFANEASAKMDLHHAWLNGLSMCDLSVTEDLYALALPKDLPVSYASIQTCIEEIIGFCHHYPNPHPLILIASQDIGKVMGMLLQPLLNQRTIAVIDEVITHEGDYVDIGRPLFGGEIVPLTVKSLAFPS